MHGFISETVAGDIYKDGQNKIIVGDKIIQHRQLPEKAKGKEMCVGVLVEKIPKEILDLNVSYMHPSGVGRSDDMHGYRFCCYVDKWNGIPGECEQISMDLEE